MTQNKALAQYQPHALGLLRIVTAYLFVMHGTTKLFQFPYIEMFANVPVTSMFGVAGIIELVGGLLMLLGLFTRPVAFVLVKLRRTLLSENFHTPMGSSHCWLYAAV